jgi:Transcriptional Coactivator p15 (PC4)
MAEKTNNKPLARKQSAQAKDSVVGEWRATKRELVRVMVRYFEGIEFVDVRRWYRDAEGKLCPGKGISIRPPDLKGLRRALRKADRLLNGDRRHRRKGAHCARTARNCDEPLLTQRRRR